MITETPTLPLETETTSKINSSALLLNPDRIETADKVMMKKCVVCGKTLPLSAFPKHSQAPDGHKRTCIDCVKKKKSSTVENTVKEQVSSKCCHRCKKELPLSAFALNRYAKDGHSTECKQCKCESERMRKIKLKKDQMKTENLKEKNESVRPVNYTPQPGHKATLNLADFSDDSIFAELKRRGWTGELSYAKSVTI